MNCTNCGAEARTTQQEGNFIDGGLSFDLVNLGFYGGFWDNFPTNGREGLAHICHDCSVVFMRALPGLAKKILPNGGGHPNFIHAEKITKGTETPSCCEFAWTWKDELDADDEDSILTYFGRADGGWDKTVCLDGETLTRENNNENFIQHH